jgi:cytochrome c biogenesis protein
MVRRVWRFLAKLDVAAILILAVLLLAALGSCFPQVSSSVVADPDRLARWETAIRGRYGVLTGLLAAGGVFRGFRSPVFSVPAVVLAIATLVCTLRRWRGLWRRVLRQRVRCSDLALDSAPHAARLTVPLDVDLSGIVRKRLECRGFRVRAAEAAKTGVVHLRGDRNRLTPLATLVTHTAVLLLLLGATLSTVYGWQEEVAIGPGGTVEIEHGDDLAVRNEGFAITRYADGSAAGYEADVAIIRRGQEVARGNVRLNEPLTYRGVSFVLTSYGGTEDHYSVTLLVVRDPGYGPVIAAGFLLLLGLTVSFNFPHCWVHARVEPDGTLRLAGRADRRAWDFGREFASLVEELERVVQGCSH